MSSSSWSLSPSQHTIRQLKLIIPGGAVVYYFGTLIEFWGILRGDGEDWGRTAAFGALTLGCTTIALFIYVLLTPWIRGVEPDYRSWRQSGILSSVIPVLTTSIISGWLLLLLTLWQYSSSGFLPSLLGACAVYALTFGLLGLLPAPKVRRD
ncbi:hypothetical protein WG66_017011 [Moniliophthora roreri]|uniref:Transmembrane protein n=1 Tax=Moniliophthora roreri TaxID=221103 RepID=A0A0W0EXU7_MONRR|nr:hypothetical protein WG66_017011 [Moniliophthora roreri]